MPLTEVFAFLFALDGNRFSVFTSPYDFRCRKAIRATGHVDVLVLANGNRRWSAFDVQNIGRNYNYFDINY